MNRFSNLNRRLYRLSGGRIGGKFPGGAKILLLSTTGRKSGKERTLPLLYLRDGDKLIIVASKGGHDHHPHWYLNLKANPDVVAQVKSDKRTMRAQDATAEEHARYWPELAAMYDGYEKYTKLTDRKIPVVVLSPR